MALIQLTSITTQSKDLQFVQDNVNKALVQLQASPFIGGNLLTGISVGTSPTSINHGLGRQPVVWVICDQNTNTTVSRTAWTATTLTLQAGSACTVSLWVN